MGCSSGSMKETTMLMYDKVTTHDPTVKRVANAIPHETRVVRELKEGNDALTRLAPYWKHFAELEVKEWFRDLDVVVTADAERNSITTDYAASRQQVLDMWRAILQRYKHNDKLEKQLDKANAKLKKLKAKAAAPPEKLADAETQRKRAKDALEADQQGMPQFARDSLASILQQHFRGAVAFHKEALRIAESQLDIVEGLTTQGGAAPTGAREAAAAAEEKAPVAKKKQQSDAPVQANQKPSATAPDTRAVPEAAKTEEEHVPSQEIKQEQGISEDEDQAAVAAPDAADAQEAGLPGSVPNQEEEEEEEEEARAP